MSTIVPNSTSTSSRPPPSFHSQPESDDEPPPYTPAVDPYQGERVLEVGPTRPFQQPQHTLQPPLQHHLSPHNTGSRSTGYLSPSRTGATTTSFGSYGNSYTQPRSLLRQITGQLANSLEEYSRERERSRNTSPPSLATPRRVPPPFQTQTPALPPRRHSSSNSISYEPQSDFARDFYTAGTGDIDGPPASVAIDTTPPTPPSRHSSPPSQTVDTSDARPSSSPIPGRPLLNDGRLLVYPAGHWCEKCQNTGYKKFQTSKPCSKCWNKYAKPYSGALAYAPAANNPGGPSNTTTFQRPLPAAVPRPPPVQRQTTLSRARSHSHVGSMSSMPPGALHYHRTRAGAGYVPQYTVSSPLLSNNYQSMSRGPMNPNSIVVRPGDMRLGGTMCWKCNGTGIKPSFTTFLLGGPDETCYICGGLGRIRS